MSWFPLFLEAPCKRSKKLCGKLKRLGIFAFPYHALEMETVCHPFVKKISVAATSIDSFFPRKGTEKLLKLPATLVKEEVFEMGKSLWLILKYCGREIIRKYFSSPFHVWDAVGREVSFECCHPETAAHGCIAAPCSRELREAGWGSPAATPWSRVAPGVSFLCKKSLWRDLHCSLSVHLELLHLVCSAQC